MCGLQAVYSVLRDDIHCQESELRKKNKLFHSFVSLAAAQAKQIPPIIPPTLPPCTHLNITASPSSAVSKSHSKLDMVQWQWKGTLLLLMVILLPYSNLAVQVSRSPTSLMFLKVLDSMAGLASMHTGRAANSTPVLESQHHGTDGHGY